MPVVSVAHPDGLASLEFLPDKHVMDSCQFRGGYCIQGDVEVYVPVVWYAAKVPISVNADG